MTGAWRRRPGPLPGPRPEPWPGARRARRPGGVVAAAAGLAILVTSLGVAAPRAMAKSGLTVIAVRVAADSPDVVVTASGGDDAAGPQRLCLQRSTDGRTWQTVGCGRAELGTGGTVGMLVRDAPPDLLFRARLERTEAAGGRPPAPDLTSGPVAVAGADPASRPVADPGAGPVQWQTNSKSAVSFSSVDNGIDTASVVRLK
jgi:hypothetical protein